VTGVLTCALPISGSVGYDAKLRWRIYWRQKKRLKR